MENAFWSRAREQMLLEPAVANLNTGSFGPLPRFAHPASMSMYSSPFRPAKSM